MPEEITVPEIEQKKNEAIAIIKNSKDVIPLTPSEKQIKEAMKTPKPIPVQITAEELEEIRQVIAERRIGGRSEGGIMPKPVNPEEERKKAINDWLKPTGMKI